MFQILNLIRGCLRSKRQARTLPDNKILIDRKVIDDLNKMINHYQRGIRELSLLASHLKANKDHTGIKILNDVFDYLNY